MGFDRLKVDFQSKPLSDTGYMHLALKEKSKSNWLARSFKILFANKDTRAEWVRQGKAHVYAKQSGPDPLAHLAETTLHPVQEKQHIQDESRVQSVVTQTFLQLNLATLHKIFPKVNLLDSLNAEQKTVLASLLELIEKETDPAEKALLIKVAKQLCERPPTSFAEIDAIDQSFKQLSAFRKEVGEQTFDACNWKKELKAGEKIDQAFINRLRSIEKAPPLTKEILLNQFDPSLLPLIENYLQAKGADLFELEDFPQKLLAFSLNLEEHHHLSQFLPEDYRKVTLQQIEALTQMAKMENQLIETHGYDPKEVASASSAYLQNLQQRHQILQAPESEALITPFLLKKVSAVKGWQEELKGEIASKLIPLMEQKGIKPVNPQEIEELKALLVIGEETQYPANAAALGIVDYLSQCRAEQRYIQAPHLGLSSLNEQILAPYCYKHLSPLEGWKEGLQSEHPFTKAFLTEMDRYSLFPVNQEELVALEKMIALGTEISERKSNGYTSADVASGCVGYLAQLREERRSFGEMVSLGGLISHISEADLYPYCFNALIQHLVQGNPEGKNVTAFFQRNPPIHGLKVPITEEGRKRLTSLLDQMINPSFAQGEGIRHPAMVGKLPTILFDLNLTSIEDFNHSNLSPKRVGWLFDQIQKEQFLLPSIHEVIDEVHKRPVESAKKLTHAVIGLLDPKGAQEINKQVDQLVDHLVAQDSMGIMALTKDVLDQTLGQLQLSESAGIHVSISTSAVLQGLREELTAIQEPEKNQKRLEEALDQIQKSLDKKDMPSFLVIRDLALKRNLSQVEKEGVISHLKGLPQEKKKEFFSFFKREKRLSPEESLEEIIQLVNAPRMFTKESLQDCGIMGEGIKAGLDAFVGMQEKRNRGIYDNEEMLKEIAPHLKLLEGELASMLVGAIASVFSSETITKALPVVIDIGTRFQIYRIEKQLKKGNDIHELQTQLKLLHMVRENEKEIVKVAAPIVSALLKHHKLTEHKKTIKAVRLLLENPNKQLNEAEKAELALLFAKSTESVIDEVGKHYPKLIENLLEAIFNLPEQKRTPSQPTATYTSVTKQWTEAEKQNLTQVSADFKNQLLTEFPLKEEAKKPSQESDSIWGVFEKGWQELKESIIDYDKNKRVREFGSTLSDELGSHPFIASSSELMLLAKEGVSVQEQTGYPPQVIALACRLSIESGKTTQEGISGHLLQATIEQAVRQSSHPHKDDPYLAHSITALLGKQIVPSQKPLNEIGRANIVALTAVLLDPNFAKGKALDLPIVVRQFKYLFPNGFDLNQEPIPSKTLKEMIEKSQILVERGVNLGLLQEGLTRNPEGALTLLATPLVDALVKDPQEASMVKKELGALVGEVHWLKEQMGSYLEKVNVLKAVQVDVSISTTQATHRLDEEKERLKVFMKKEGRIPNAEEAAKLGIVVPQLVMLVKEVSVLKEILNGTIPNQPEKKDLLLALPKISTGLKIAKPFLGIIQKIPGLTSALEGVLPQILKWVIQDQIQSIQTKVPITPKDEFTLTFLKLLLEKDTMEKLVKIALPLVNGILGRHDWTRHNTLVDQLIKIGDPENKNGVDEIELMTALLDSAGVIMEEINTHYSEVIPDLLNAIKSIQLGPILASS